MLAFSGSVQCSDCLGLVQKMRYLSDFQKMMTEDDCLFRYLSDFQNCLLLERFNLPLPSNDESVYTCPPDVDILYIVEEVQHILQKLDTGKANGSDRCHFCSHVEAYC